LESWPNSTASSIAPTAMTPSTTIPMVPAPASTAGMVNTPVPTMLPTTSPVAEVSPIAWALSLFRDDIGWPGITGCTGTSGSLESDMDAHQIAPRMTRLRHRGLERHSYGPS
jgi:hypothetical protein